MPDVVLRFGGRDGTWDFNYGPWTYGEVAGVDSDCESLPPVDYGNIGHDSWTIRMSLRADGLPMQFWQEKLDRVDGSLLRMIGDEIVYDTLLYRMTLSRSTHEEFDRDLAHLFHGYLREMIKLGPLLVNFKVTEELVWDIAREGAWFIMAPSLEHEMIELDDKGFYHRRSADSDRDIEP